MSKAKRGHPVSEEQKRKLIERNTGKKASEETKKKMSETAKKNNRKPPSWKGKKHTSETKKKISESQKGEKHHNYGKHLTMAHRGNISKAISGEKCYKWRGGISLLTHRIRESFKNRQWISDVFSRDNFTCNICGTRGCYLHAHHIKSFNSILQYYEIITLGEALNCAELWNINNGITLCKECHKKIHKKVINNVNDKSSNEDSNTR